MTSDRINLFFFHVPKTGGTSVTRYLKDLAHTNKIYFLYKGHAKPEIADTVGNYSFTILRDPSSHCASMYGYHKHMAPTTSWVNQFASSRNLYEWVKDFDQMNNYYCNYFGGGSYEESIEMLNHIDFILFQESLNSDVNKMAEQLGITYKFNYYVNKTSRKPVVDQATKELINKRRALDYKLYKWAKDGRTL